MAVELRCGELMPGCDYVAKADSPEDLMKKVVAHAKTVHNINEITPDLQKKVMGAVRTT